MENFYARGNFISTSALEKLSGNFEALGFLWVLREILGGKNEGVINLHSLGVNIRDVYGFISGGWLEIWTYCRAIQILTGGYSCVRNLNVMLPENEPSEFDIMVCTRGNIFWIEAKTSRYSAYIPKYSRIAEILGLPPSNAILVSPDSPLREIQQGITCCSLEGFPAVFSESLNACM